MPPQARPSSCGRQHRSVGRDRCGQLENLWLSDITVKDRGVAWTTSSTDGQAAGRPVPECGHRRFTRPPDGRNQQARHSHRQGAWRQVHFAHCLPAQSDPLLICMGNSGIAATLADEGCRYDGPSYSLFFLAKAGHFHGIVTTAHRDSLERLLNHRPMALLAELCWPSVVKTGDNVEPCDPDWSRPLRRCTCTSPGRCNLSQPAFKRGLN